MSIVDSRLSQIKLDLLINDLNRLNELQCNVEKLLEISGYGAKPSFFDEALQQAMPLLKQCILARHRLIQLKMEKLENLDGFVQPLPDFSDGSDQKSEGNKFQENEKGGMGEGEGCKDVSEEIEDIGQIENTKHDTEEKKDDESRSRPEDIQQPIEMEEDIGADLENMDLDESEEDMDDQEEEMSEPEWKMGDAEEAEEDELGGDLCEEKKGVPLDDSSVGAGREEADLAAKDPDADKLSEMGNEDEQPVEQSSSDEEEEEEEGSESDNVVENVDIRDTRDHPQITNSGEDEQIMEDNTSLQESVAGIGEEEEEKADDLASQSLFQFTAQGQGGEGEANEEEVVNEKSETDLQQVTEKSEEGGCGHEKESRNSKDFKAIENVFAEDLKDIRKDTMKQVEERTLGDSQREWRQGPAASEATVDSGPQAESSLWSHAPNLPESSAQVLSSGTLEEAQSQNIRKASEAEDRENLRKKDQCEVVEDKQTEDMSVDSERVLKDENQDDSDSSEPNSRLKPDNSTIHTVWNFYDHASMMLQKECNLNISCSLPTNDNDYGSVSGLLWAKYQSLTESLAAELAENLRLILEPTQASKLQGDYRSGKRLNVRKLVPYVASSYRKDKIWLRRTKKAKRDYQILIAIDDSSSMQDNKSRQLAYESLALLGRSLRYLEVGQFGICKFGEDTELLHPFTSTFSEESGSSIMGSLRFTQQKTNINKLLEFCLRYFLSQPCTSAADNGNPAQLLLILSDGRGLFAEGIDKVRSAVQKTLAARIFPVFIVLDNPDHKDSILDIKVPVFGQSGEAPLIKSYMDFFPFPFYIILRRISSLPAVVGEALRQWFEVVADKSC